MHVRCERMLSMSERSALSCVGRISRCDVPLFHCFVDLTSSVLLDRDGSSDLMAIFCLRLSLLAGRPGRLSPGTAAGDRVEGGAARVLELDADMAGGVCEVLAACEEAMDEDEFLGRAVTSGDVARVLFIALVAAAGEAEADGDGG